HTRDLDQLSILQLRRALPFAAFAFVIASAASMGIPGFSGFAAEITILLGAWKSYPLAVWITGIGMVFVAAFTLRALKRSFFDDGGTTSVSSQTFEPITLAEKAGAILLMSATLAAGIFPKLLLDRIMPAVQSM